METAGSENLKPAVHLCCHLWYCCPVAPPPQVYSYWSHNTGNFSNSIGGQRLVWAACMVWAKAISKDGGKLNFKLSKKTRKPSRLAPLYVIPTSNCTSMCRSLPGAGYWRPRKPGPPSSSSWLAVCGWQMRIFKHSPRWNNMLDFTKWTETLNKRKQPTASMLTPRTPWILQMSPNTACICFPYVNKAEAAQDELEWNVNLHFIYLFFLFLADDTILVLSHRSFWLEKK